MPRTARIAPGGLVLHVLNRGVGKNQLFFNDDDYLAFERIIADTLAKRPMRILSYCLIPNHWHLYQGRFKSFPVESDEHFYQVNRYVRPTMNGKEA